MMLTKHQMLTRTVDTGASNQELLSLGTKSIL